MRCVLPLVSLVLLALAACNPAARAAETPIDLQVAPLSDIAGGSAINASAPAPKGERCMIPLSGGKIWKSSPGCYLDQHVTEVPGMLDVPCSGDGAAHAIFGDHRYIGRVTNGIVEVELEGELDWEDGCHWGTRASIKGTVQRDEKPAQERLAWTYLDRVISGNDCSGVCTARTAIDVGSKPPTPSDVKERSRVF